MNILWTEKYKQDEFEKLGFNHSVNDILQNLVAQGDMPHLIIYGPDGSGKKTRVNCLLAKLYGKGCLKTTKSTYSVKTNTTTTEIAIRSSRSHIEMMPTEAAHNDVHVLIKLMKETAANALNPSDSKNNFLTFVLYDAENLSLKAQAALRRTMEKYSNRIRIIMVCLAIATLIPALKSRCLMIRNSAPKTEDVRNFLELIIRKEGFKNVAPDLLIKASENCDRNLRKAILSLQACIATKDMSGSMILEHWKEVVRKAIVDKVFTERSVELVKKTRNIFYELLTCQVPGDIIIREILLGVLHHKEFPKSVVLELKEAAVSCDKQMKQGDREIIYLEAFFVKVLLIVERAGIK